MRFLGFASLAGAVFVAACASKPNYGTGAAGTNGGAGTGGGGTGGGSSYTPPALTIAHPNPIISRAAQVFSSPPNGNFVVNGQYHNGGWPAGAPNTASPSWVAIKLTATPTTILASWDDGGTYDYKDPSTTTVYGLPADYHFEVSPDSTNGTDGTWTMATDPSSHGPVEVTGNQVRTRAHAIDFTGMSWVKMVITAAPANANGGVVQIGEIDVHDISATGAGLPDDTWFFMGDSITAFAYDRQPAHQPAFPALVHGNAPAYYPAIINGGIGGEKTTDALARIQEALTLNPSYRFFVLGYGTNDSAGDQIPVATFSSNLQMLIDMVKAAGRVPIIPHIPYTATSGHGDIPSYNAAIDALTESNQLQIGPDFYGMFMAHPEYYDCPCTTHPMDGLHPGDAGMLAMNLAWADAVVSFYP
jgi:lysophospholipase L1-like esterase